jgi:GNAT superfamily N-acetyltransferase
VAGGSKEIMTPNKTLAQNKSLHFGSDMAAATIPCAQSEWGTINAIPITEGRTFAALFRKLEVSDQEEHPDGRGFHHNLEWLVDGLLEKRLFTLEVTENGAMFDTYAGRDPVFCVDGYTLPCFLLRAKEESVCTILWVHPCARRRGFGTMLVKQLGITYARHALEGSEKFWDSVGIKP